MPLWGMGLDHVFVDGLHGIVKEKRRRGRPHRTMRTAQLHNAYDKHYSASVLGVEVQTSHDAWTMAELTHESQLYKG